MTLAHGRALLSIEKILYSHIWKYSNSNSHSNRKLSNKAGEGWGYKNDPEAKRREWPPGNDVLKVLNTWRWCKQGWQRWPLTADRWRTTRGCAPSCLLRQISFNFIMMCRCLFSKEEERVPSNNFLKLAARPLKRIQLGKRWVSGLPKGLRERRF